ncbi:ABC transporter substrate-binding protein [Algoriphagus formosus]|uniref:ABC transporter substrate-binding protein n=1 Tax=Algoriphagus formosus TaxID=2007308 RepID=UPI003F7042CA
MQKSLLFLALLFLVLTVNAQNAPEGYLQVKRQLASGSYWDAMNSFQAFQDESKYGKLALYASYHAGESALKANQAETAIGLLKPLASRNWENQNETKILLAESYLLNRNISEGLELLKSLPQSYSEQGNDLAYKYLVQQSPDFLVRNLKEYQDIPAFTAALSTVLNKKTVLSADEKSLYYELRGQGENWSTGNTVKNDILDLVVILPFSSGTQSPDPESFIFELYEGILLGIDQLKSEGMRVSISTFNSKRSVDNLRSILSDEKVKSADVIIGPIYPEETDLVSAFAESTQIPFIHPLSNLGDRFEDKNYSFLFRPSAENISEGVFRAVKGQSWGSRIAIGYGGSSKDLRSANELKERIESDGFQLVDFKELNPRNAASFLTDLGIRPTLDSVEANVDQVIILSDDPNIASPILSFSESVATEIPILVLDSWLSFNFANYEMLPHENYYFIANNTPNYESETMKLFRNEYYQTHSTLPSLNAILGFELVYWVAMNARPDLGYDFRASLDQRVFAPGKLTWGFNFQNSNSNRYVPVFSLSAGELKPLNY